MSVVVVVFPCGKGKAPAGLVHELFSFPNFCKPLFSKFSLAEPGQEALLFQVLSCTRSYLHTSELRATKTRSVSQQYRTGSFCSCPPDGNADPALAGNTHCLSPLPAAAACLPRSTSCFTQGSFEQPLQLVSICCPSLCEFALLTALMSTEVMSAT